MTAVAKRQWGPQYSINEGVSVAIDWVEKARSKNILAVRDPSLFHAYVVGPIEGLIDWGKPLSEVFKWSSRDTPANHRARDAAIRLLAVAFKAHFFIERNDKIAHEPYLFVIPDVANPQSQRYGLIYRLSQSAKTILVGEGDLGRIATDRVRVGRFPVVLVDDFSGRQKWFNIKHWNTLADQSEVLTRIARPWAGKREREGVNQHTDLSSFPYGTVFDIPYYLKDLGPALGMEWATGIKRWYLPLGFDVDPVKIFVDYVISTTPPPEQSSGMVRN